MCAVAQWRATIYLGAWVRLSVAPSASSSWRGRKNREVRKPKPCRKKHPRHHRQKEVMPQQQKHRQRQVVRRSFRRISSRSWPRTRYCMDVVAAAGLGGYSCFPFARLASQGKVKKEKPQWNAPKKEKKAKAVPPPKASFVNTTPKGEKKDLSGSMEAAYHPQAVEAAWQDWWEASGFYSCDPATAVDRSPDEKFVMVIPPPNVTGSLHLGHALTAAVEDTLTRWHRMKGHATLYVPGK